jgi:hypothetical protein
VPIAANESVTDAGPANAVRYDVPAGRVAAHAAAAPPPTTTTVTTITVTLRA